MSEGLKGNYKMRFIGFKDGMLIPMAPGSYEQGKIYMMPIRHMDYPWWEIIEPPPKLKIPPPTPKESALKPIEEDITKLQMYMPDELDETEQTEGEELDEEFIPSKSMTKKELVQYIRAKGGTANMAMLKEGLLNLALSLK